MSIKAKSSTGKVARLAAAAGERGWVVKVLGHDRCLTAQQPLGPGVYGRLQIIRAGVMLELESAEGEKVIELDRVPTPAEAAVCW